MFVKDGVTFEDLTPQLLLAIYIADYVFISYGHELGIVSLEAGGVVLKTRRPTKEQTMENLTEKVQRHLGNSFVVTGGIAYMSIDIINP